MTVLQVKNLAKEYDGEPILTGLSLHLSHRERVGLVGANGSGKSTLLKILAGVLPADGGTMEWLGVTRAYLPQEAPFDPDRPLREQVAGVPADLLGRCGIGPEVLAQLAGTLSGGQKTRAALALVLAAKPKVLLLDEPTNHLDVDGLRWLEELLVGYPGAVIVVSHDRYFLDRVATRILELEHGQVQEYPGNYSAYARQKRAEQEKHQADYRQYVKEKKALEAAIRREQLWAQSAHNSLVTSDMPMNAFDFVRRQAKAHSQIAKSMEQRLERIKVEKPRDAARIHIRVDGGESVGRDLVLARGLGFQYPGASGPVFRGAEFFVQRGDRLAVVGPNGAGKTTLVRLLLGQLEPTEGSLRVAPVRVAYLAQEMENLDPKLSVLAEASGGNTALDQAMVRTLLGCLLFSGEDVLKPVSVLSGGEKVRLALAKILLSGPDLLVLDEPTNGLDLLARERVEEALDDFAGTLILVSHDRYLLRKLATRVLAVENGSITVFGGGYDAYVDRGAKPARDDAAERILLLETRLAQLSAALAAPKAEEAERLNAEFIAVSRELRALLEAAHPKRRKGEARA